MQAGWSFRAWHANPALNHLKNYLEPGEMNVANTNSAQRQRLRPTSIQMARMNQVGGFQLQALQATSPPLERLTKERDDPFVTASKYSRCLEVSLAGGERKCPGSSAQWLAWARSSEPVKLEASRESVSTEFGASRKVVKTQIAIAYIHGHFTERLRISTIAALVHISSRHLNRIFHETVRMSAKEYIVRTRVRYAKLDLKQTDKSIHQIAVDCGFYDQSVFTKFFRRTVGKTPLVYRRHHLSRVQSRDPAGPAASAPERELDFR